MLHLKLKYFFKSEILNQNEKIYLLTKKCTCVACESYSLAFRKGCSEDKLVYLNYISRP